MFCDPPQVMRYGYMESCLLHILSGSFLNAFVVYICGKVSLILSFCRANASSTSSGVIGQVERSLRHVQATHSPACFKLLHYLRGLPVPLGGSQAAPSQG